MFSVNIVSAIVRQDSEYWVEYSAVMENAEDQIVLSSTRSKVTLNEDSVAIDRVKRVALWQLAKLASGMVSTLI